ncbi:general transcription factor IIH subunit 3 isoform X2 [Lampetra fluviatilis]
MATDEDINLLVIVLDVNPIWWGTRKLQNLEFTLPRCVDAVMVFANSHLAMSRNHRLAVIASHNQESRFLYPASGTATEQQASDAGDSAGPRDGRCELLATANHAIATQITALLANTEVTADMRSDSLLAGSLAKALCYIHRIMKENEGAGQDVKSRILVIKAADDSASQYMNFMNVIFAAQKQNIFIDACVLGSDSGLLQQACDITGGIYLQVPQIAALLQYLQWVFLPDPELRASLVLPPPVQVDYRAACFCHRNLIAIGYVCSVCLSIFCTFSPICTTCDPQPAREAPRPAGQSRTAFRLALPLGLKTKKKKSKLPSGLTS